ncbi:hypothetical protein MTP04_32830 [Lysinibacillus sp. PLM2]|nr:hypothetical protein MTP04_32830 [Lysinibacillus sp. PLM2]
MTKKSNDSFDLMLYSGGLALAFFVFLSSRWLSLPLMKEIESGTSLADIVFKENNEVGFFWNLLVPTALWLIGIAILTILLWQMIKSIVIRKDSKFNKFLLILIAFIILVDLWLTLIHGWDLLVLNLQYLILVVVLLVLIGCMIQFFVLQKK